MGKLLTNNDSFYWEDNLVDRGSFIEDLSQAINSASNFHDDIFRTPGLYDIECSWGKLFEFLWNSCYDHEVFQERFPWITQSQFQAFTNISYLIQPTTPENSSNLLELFDEYGEDNYAWIGFWGCTTERLVHDINSWTNFHREYVSTFDPQRRREEIEYFRQFYIPELTVAANQINTLIIRRNTHPIFERLDIPAIVENELALHHEQIQMHFRDENNSALNIDGTWKHGGFKIPNHAGEILEEWGFLLPPDYY